jgi:hypothetical protein
MHDHLAEPQLQCDFDRPSLGVQYFGLMRSLNGLPDSQQHDLGLDAPQRTRCAANQWERQSLDYAGDARATGITHQQQVTTGLKRKLLQKGQCEQECSLISRAWQTWPIAFPPAIIPSASRSFLMICSGLLLAFHRESPCPEGLTFTPFLGPCGM